MSTCQESSRQWLQSMCDQWFPLGFTENQYLIIEGVGFGADPDVRILNGSPFQEIYDPQNEWVNEDGTLISVEIGPEINDFVTEDDNSFVFEVQTAFGTPQAASLHFDNDATMGISSISPW